MREIGAIFEMDCDITLYITVLVLVSLFFRKWGAKFSAECELGERVMC